MIPKTSKMMTKLILELEKHKVCKDDFKAGKYLNPLYPETLS